MLPARRRSAWENRPEEKSRAVCPGAGRVLWAETTVRSAPEKASIPKKGRWAPWAPSTTRMPPWRCITAARAGISDNTP